MASLPTKSFNQIVTDTIAGIQGRATKLINFSQGSALRAITEGFAGLFLWFQAVILQVLAATRLSTSTGIDVDTFTADFMPVLAGSTTTALPNGSPRLGAQASSGQATFSRITAGPSSCFIPVGATVRTTDGSQNFSVTADTTFGTYSALLGGYTLPSSVASIVVPVAAVVPGIAGNVASGAISLITSPIVGIDAVTNVAAFSNGFDRESDIGLKNRFAAYILGLSRGDLFGLNANILSVKPLVQYTVTEGFNYDGTYHPGYFLVVADDGSGSPTAAFLTSITNAANAVRPLGVQFAVFAPVIIFADVSMVIKTAPNYNHSTIIAQVAAIIALNINNLGLGTPLPWSILASWAYSIPGVTTVSSVTLNTLTGDAASLSVTHLCSDSLTTIAYATIKARTLTIS